MKLFSEQLRILKSLESAHKSGEIEVTFENLAIQLSIPLDEVKRLYSGLLALGLVDKVEVIDRASLSAKGLKVAKESDSRSAHSEAPPESPFEFRDNIVNTEAQEKFARDFQVARVNFELALDYSSLTSAEKEKLRAMSREFFWNPAIIELLCRALTWKNQR